MLTTEQLAERKSYLGASEVAAVLGVDPWRTPLEVYLAKRGEIPATTNDESEAIELGHALESSLVALMNSRLRLRGVMDASPIYITDQPEFRIDGTPIVAHPDAIVRSLGDPACLHLREIKTTRLTNQYGAIDEWGEEWTDEIPRHMVVQAHVQLQAADLDDLYLGALIGGVGFRVYHVRRHDLGRVLVEKATDWWDRHVVGGIEPPMTDATRDLPALRSKIRVAKTVEVDEVLMMEARSLVEKAKEVEAAKDAAIARVMRAMGDADEAHGGGWVYKVNRQTSRRVSVSTLRERYPSIADDCTAETESVVGRWKKAKDGDA